MEDEGGFSGSICSTLFWGQLLDSHDKNVLPSLVHGNFLREMSCPIF